MGCNAIAYGDRYFEMCSVTITHFGTLLRFQGLKQTRI